MNSKNQTIEIFVAAHKPYEMPNDEIYTPIQVGTSLNKPFDIKPDNTGKNISEKNPKFCELTALYWAWKNSKADYIGLVHYRRHFQGKNKNVLVNKKLVLNSKEVEKLLGKSDVILPQKRHYYIMNLYQHYAKTMSEDHLIATEKIIKNKYPEYLSEFKKLKSRTSMHAFNMFIMKKEILDKYCAWLFPILFELEKEIDTTDYTTFEKRFIGRISERLLDIWINTNNIPYTETKAIDIEPVNWLKKGSGFLFAKFAGRQYAKSW